MEAKSPLETTAMEAKNAFPGSRRRRTREKDKGLNDDSEDVVFIVRNEGHTACIKERLLTAEVSPVLAALVAERAEESGLPKGQQDAHGRYLLEGPTNPHAFAFLVECVRRSGIIAYADVAERLPDLDSRLEACRYVDYYLLPGPAKAQLTKLLLEAFVVPPEQAEEVFDVTKLGLCRSEMIMEKIHLEGLNMRGLHLENSHAKQMVIKRCTLSDCQLDDSVTAGEILISRSRLTRVSLGVFATNIRVEDESELLACNIRVVEELNVHDSDLHNCTFRGSDEDRKDRQLISGVFHYSEIHGDVHLPFDKIVCEESFFFGKAMHMTKGGASISFLKTRIYSLPSIEGKTRVNLCLEDCDLIEALTFRQMMLQLRNVRFAKPCEFVDVDFVEKVNDITFPRRTKFRQVKFKEGMQACIASGCSFEGCNLGFGQDAVAGCVLTQCNFQACRFPFAEADSPVANMSGCSFSSCQIQWSGQFPHEESFVINSYWLRKWNLAGSTATEGQASPRVD